MICCSFMVSEDSTNSELLRHFLLRCLMQNTPVTLLSQSGPALFAYASIDVAAKIFFARGADPVKSGKINKRKYDKELRYGKVLLREFPEQIRPFMQEREQEKE
jgi:hypothetical protein